MERYGGSIRKQNTPLRSWACGDPIIMRLCGVLGEELSVVGMGNGEPVEIAIGIEIGKAECVVELFFAQCGKVGNIVATEEQQGGERDIIHEAGTVVSFNHLHIARVVRFGD